MLAVDSLLEDLCQRKGNHSTSKGANNKSVLDNSFNLAVSVAVGDRIKVVATEKGAHDKPHWKDSVNGIEGVIRWSHTSYTIAGQAVHRSR